MKSEVDQADLYLAIDQGGHASRALVFDVSGQLVASATVDIETFFPGPDRVEHDAEAVLESIGDAIDQIAEQLGDRASRIRGAGLATQRSSIVCWDRQSGKALSAVLSWQDRRGANWLEQFHDRESVIRQRTGLVLSPHYGASKLRWCLNSLPEVMNAQEQGRLALGPLASFLLFRLLEERPLLVDPATASRTQLVALESGNWSPELLQWFGVPEDGLPECVASNFLFGHLSVAKKYRVPLIVSTGDQSAALYGMGQPDVAGVYINLGTGAFVQRLSMSVPSDESNLLRSVVVQRDEQVTYALEGTVNGAGRALRKLSTQFGYSRQEMEHNLPDWLDRATNVPLFLNGVSGLGSPFWISHFTSKFVGEGESWEKMVAVAESIIFLLQLNITEIARVSGPPAYIRVSGGLSVVSGMLQRLADLSGLPVHRLSLKEATAAGLAYLVSDGKISKQHEAPVIFAPGTNAPLQHRYQQWSKEMQACVDTNPDEKSD